MVQLCHLTSLVAQTVKILPAMQETRVRSLGWEDRWRRKWQPTPVSLPGESHGRRSLVGYSLQGSQRVGHDWATSLSLSLICTWLLEKPALTMQTFVGKVMSLLFNTLSSFVIAFLPRSKCLLNFMAEVTFYSNFGAQENKVCHCFHFSPIYLPWSDGTRCHDLSFFECWVLSQLFHSPLSPLWRDSVVPLHFLPLRWCHLHIWGYWFFSWQSWFQLVFHPAQHFT